MEHEKYNLIPFDGGWSDVGSWDSLSTLIDRTSPDLADNAHEISWHFGYTNGRTGWRYLKDLIIVDDGDAVLVAQKKTEHVKAIVEELKASVQRQSTLRISPLGYVRKSS